MCEKLKKLFYFHDLKGQDFFCSSFVNNFGTILVPIVPPKISPHAIFSTTLAIEYCYTDSRIRYTFEFDQTL